MRNITECFENTRSIAEHIEYEQVNEGLKDILNAVKDKFKKAWAYLKGVVVKAGAYFLPTTEEGILLPAISPLTAGQAYKDGYINKNSTLVVLDKEGQSITGCKTKPMDAVKLYGEGNSLQYWRRMLKECQELYPEAMVNEVRLENQDPEAKYNVIVDDAALKKHVKMALKNKKLAKLLIWGAPGIGKTAILLTVLDEMKADFPDYRLIVKTLSNETPDNFTLPKYTEEVDDTDFTKLAKDLNKKPSYITQLLKKVGMSKATDVPKTWLPVYKPTGDKELDAYLDAQTGSGLLFVDELSRATPQVLNVILPLVNEGNFNGYVMGSGWTIICASNRAEDEMSGQSTMGNALLNRFAQVYYEPCVKSWRHWADNQNFISPLLLQWLSMPEGENMSGAKFYYMDPNEDMDSVNPTTLMCTPRSWTNAMRELAEYSHTGTLEGFSIFDIDKNIIAMTLNKYVPASAIDSFLAFLEVISKIGDFDAAVHDVWQNGGKNFKLAKKDLNKVLLPVSQLICTAHGDKLPSEEEFQNLADWLVSQSSDQLASYTIDIFKNVFAADVAENQRAHIFLLKKYVHSPKMKGSIDMYKEAFSGFFNRWKCDLETMPDYSAGLKTIAKKYGAAFQAAIVDGQEALG